MKHAPRILAVAKPHVARLALAIALLTLSLALAAPHAHGDDANVKIKTPLGNISAKSRGAPDFVSGIPEYPGATRTEGDPDGDGAQVTLKLPVISMKMQALRFETDASMEKVAEYYREKLGRLGKLKESDDGPHSEFGDFHWTPAHGQHTIAAEADHRVYMVAMKPIEKGTQFALFGLRFEE